MKYSVICLGALAIVASSVSLAQTLHVPGGTLGTSSNSNVGIGTTSPQAKLEVNGDVRLGGFTGANADEWPKIVWYRDTANGWDEGLIKVSSARGVFGRAGYGIHMDGSRHFGFFSSGWNTLLDIEGGTGRTYIKGSVGVGTANPVGQLELFSSSTTQLRLHRSGVAEMSVGIYGGNGAYFSTNADSFRFLTANGGGGATGGSEVVRITSAGNMGIGTTSPTHKLSVNGTIRAKEVIVESGWADFVFADDYKLAPLSEVEAHIKAHKHLPGVPSAAEVAEKGVSMGEMQSKMMAKIEEMMLHMIDLKKENAELRREVEALKAGAAP